MSSSAYAIATMDTKGAELAFVAQRLTDAGVKVVTVDIGTGGKPVERPQIDRERVATSHPDGVAAVIGQTDRGRRADGRPRRSPAAAAHQ